MGGITVFEVASVGEFVEVDDGLIAAGQPVEDEVGADESRAAGDKKGHEMKGLKVQQWAGPIAWILEGLRVDRLRL